VLSIARTSSANVCFFDDIGRPLSRPDSSARVNRLLKALCLMGFMVCVHSPENDMLSLEAAATYIWDDKYSARTLRARRHRPFARRCVELPWLREPSWSDRLRQMEAAIDRAGLEALRRDLVRDSWPSMLEFLRFATVDEWIGGNFGGDRRRSLLNAGGQEGRYAAWLATYTGGDWHAARSALAAVKSERPEPKLYLLWKAICGAIAGNRAALKELRGLLGSPDESLVIDPLLRGLAATGRLKHADQIIAELGERHKFAPWMIDRLRADVRLDTDKNSTALEDAARWLESLAQDESLSLVHRAETLHNLGTALDRLGDREAALAVFQRAIALNPFLEASREELAASKNPA
jgi:tetratricopeptide (TPR) repeat protein